MSDSAYTRLFVILPKQKRDTAINLETTRIICVQTIFIIYAFLRSKTPNPIYFQATSWMGSHICFNSGQVSDFSSCTGMCLLSPELSLIFFPQILHWMSPLLCFGLIWSFRVHKVRYAWSQWDIEDPWVLCGHFL